MSSEHKFPSPIGGIPFPHDFTPALIFTILYALTVPVAVWRMIDKRSRSLSYIGTVTFSVERIADFAIRAAEAQKPNIRTTNFFVSWLQSAYALGFLSTTQDLNNIARLFVVKALKGTSFIVEIPPQAFEDRTFLPLEEEQPLKPMRLSGHTSNSSSYTSVVLRLQAIALGSVSGGLYFTGITNETVAKVVRAMNYASTIIVLFLQLVALYEVLWALSTRPNRIPRGPALYLCSMLCIIMIPSVYRLAAMSNSTTSLLSMAPGSLNGPMAKALFYSLHIAPEWLSGAMLLAVNVKEVFGVPTGLKSQ
ncbi:uncharacterized protein B0H18DRAFT_1147056 [Fomitopsis serialis]|uniref:uncharacterized protein n=1 Tax=Fomitopsis serialis TaxID=139415 RepID=UPI002007ECA6|nr:uncharacterized protein B0H18DRAFT_1147056 [Neoantrodia serialis]KAH9913855.1 hypothetical protein B0H18DRAFT_1147056 [Neoantrodia serialis]